MSLKNLDRKKYKVKEIIQSYLSLEKRGSNYWALCPFHDDSRASLSVSEEKNIFKCFACGVAGDAISFIMRREKLELQVALLRAHEILKLPTDELKFLKKLSPEDELRKNILKFNQFMLDFYSRSLNSPIGKHSLSYLKEERKLSEEIIHHFKIGYAPPSSEVIETLNNMQKISPEYKFLNQDFLLQTGQFHLAGGKLTHNFKDRIIFPIYSERSEVLSFSARTFKEGSIESRYLHSKETIVFKKSTCVYNLQTLQQVKKDSPIYLFEGFFDVYAAYAINPDGIYLALLGSQLSDETLKLLSKSPSRVLVLALDSDETGRASTLQLFKKSVRYGFKLFALPPLSGKDLAESYQLDNSLKLPEPIIFSEWIKLNWTKLFAQHENENKLPYINQLVLSCLDSLFYHNSINNQIFLRSGVTPKNASAALDQIFQLYKIVTLTKQEEEMIETFKSQYVEVSNLSLLNSNVISHLIYEDKIENEQTSSELITEFSNISKNLEQIVKFHSTSIFLQTRKSQWESILLSRYSDELQLVLSKEEQQFLKQIIESLDNLSSTPTSLDSNNSLKECIGDLLSFFELYYQLIHYLINKYEYLIKRGPKIDLKKRINLLDRIDQDRKQVSGQASTVFGEILEWEKQKSKLKN